MPKLPFLTSTFFWKELVATLQFFDHYYWQQKRFKSVNPSFKEERKELSTLLRVYCKEFLSLQSLPHLLSDKSYRSTQLKSFVFGIKSLNVSAFLLMQAEADDFWDCYTPFPPQHGFLSSLLESTAVWLPVELQPHTLDKNTFSDLLEDHFTLAAYNAKALHNLTDLETEALKEIFAKSSWKELLWSLYKKATPSNPSPAPSPFAAPLGPLGDDFLPHPSQHPPSNLASLLGTPLDLESPSIQEMLQRHGLPPELVVSGYKTPHSTVFRLELSPPSPHPTMPGADTLEAFTGEFGEAGYYPGSSAFTQQEEAFLCRKRAYPLKNEEDLGLVEKP